jgi:hypothetical protein
MNATNRTTINSSLASTSLAICGALVLLAASCATGDTSTGGNGGSSGKGGSGGGQGGTSGTPTGTGSCTVSASDTTISDMEETTDSGTSFFQSGCMVGAWYATGDPSGTLSPAQGSAFKYDCDAGDAHGGKCCAKVTATNFQANATSTTYTDWGWEEGLGLDSPSTTEAHGVNASAKNGITFWAKGDSARSVVVELGTVCTVPSTRPGGACVATASLQCDIGFASTINVTTSWQQFNIAWASFAQPTWSGYTVCTDKQNAIVTINFKNDSSGSGVGSSWTGQLNGSIYVDDLAFM